jgi:Holliday junction resolvasome RuvABC ATP-dependent DNA helicase subunit
MTYNQKRHIQLLKRSQDLKNQGKNLFIKNREEDLELSKYNIAVEQHIFWQDRYQVALLMEDFLNRKIDGKELCARVYGLRRKLIDTCEKFLLQLTSGSEKIKTF